MNTDFSLVCFSEITLRSCVFVVFLVSVRRFRRDYARMDINLYVISYTFALILCGRVCHGVSYRSVKPEDVHRLQTISIGNRAFCNASTTLEAQTLLLDKGSVYVGATNFIFQFSAKNLTLQGQFQTGPKNDSQDPTCAGPPFCQPGLCVGVTCFDSYNKLLLPHRDVLIACGTVHRTCDLLNLTDIGTRWDYQENDLKCKQPQHSLLSVRERTASIVAATYENKSDASGEKDLLYLGGVDWSKSTVGVSSILTYFAPSKTNPSFTNLDSVIDYISNAPGVTFIKAWTTAVHGFVVWRNEHNKTMLSRLCHQVFFNEGRRELETRRQNGKYSYVETEINCGQNFDRVTSAQVFQNTLFALFASKLENKYAVCSASFAELNLALDRARQGCFDQNTTVAMYRGSDGKTAACHTSITSTAESVNCGFPSASFGFISLPGGITSKIPVEMVKKLSLDAENGTPLCFAATSTNNNYVLFFGTSSGKLLKYLLSGATNGPFEVISVSSNAIVSDLYANPSTHFIYGITKNEVFRVKEDNCQSYTSCQSCLEGKDPYCGWCIQSSRCTALAECSESSNPQRWIEPLSSPGLCPVVSSFSPMNVSVGNSVDLRLVFGGRTLDNRTEPYTCHLTRGQVEQNASLLDFPSNPRCSFTSAALGLFKPLREDHSNVILSIKYKGEKMASASLALAIYDCSLIPKQNNYTMCSSCALSRWQCAWCLETSTCVPGTCGSGVRIAAGSAACPTLANYTGSSLIPYNATRDFVLNVVNLPAGKQLKCNYQLCGVARSSTATTSAVDGTVTCKASAQVLSCDQRHYDVRVFLSSVSGNYVIDSPRSLIATVYNCGTVSSDSDCGTCLQFRKRFVDCLWCNATNSCQTSAACPSEKTPVTSVAQCASPTITSVSPMSGPTSGGTEITIEGSNLGVYPSDVTVKVGDKQCTMVVEKYKPSRRVVCVTRPAMQSDQASVVLKTNRTVTYKRNFSYKVVTASALSPVVVLNKTQISVSGNNLDVGNGAGVIVNGSKVICTERKSTSVKCSSPEVKQPGNYTVLVMVDGFQRQLPVPLQYFPVPGIVNLRPLSSFQSGGRNVSLNLTDARGVYSATLEVTGGTSVPCDIMGIQLTCRVPSISPSTARRKRAVSPTKSVYLLINGVHKVDAGTITYHSDPTVRPLSPLSCESSADSSAVSSEGNATQGQSTQNTYTVEISGSGFKSAGSLASDYQVVLIADSETLPCTVSFIDDTSIICRAPSQLLSSYKNRLVRVQVDTGAWSHTSNEVMYCKGDDPTAVIVVVVVIVVLVVVACVVFWVHKRNQSKKRKIEQKEILSKLEDLENKTRETARNAYFELQVGYMTNLTENLSLRITYLPASVYLTQTLFNKMSGHPVQDQSALKCYPLSTTESLRQFVKLLKEREFLLTVVKTMEEQRNFTAQDKGNVASLLTVCLLSDLPYYTRIMFELLGRLIEKHVAKNPKLLLRRSESVVEKLVSHWLSITLYDECIMKSAGKPIFLLSKAIHYLVSSSPCDVIAKKAINSLNEMTLLGSEVAHEPIVLNAMIEEGDDEHLRSNVEVKVIDVDTITQAKVKIIEAVYRDRPYSEYPKPDDLEFEWLSSSEQKQGLVLSDIDSTTEHDGQYSKINTLKHYKVPSTATVLLRPPSDELHEDEASRGSFTQFLNRAFSFDVRLPPSSPRSDSVFSASHDSKSPLLTSRRLYHLIHPRDDEAANGGVDLEEGGGERKTKAMIDDLMNRPFQEMFLTRMVRSKATLQKYVDDVFNAILCPNPLPTSVRYIFQFLDNEAAKHKVNEAEVVHIWKTNSLLLRYWVNVLKNPEFLFDANKTEIVDSCLNVITQAFMDACATTTRKLGHDSPSNKLLYAKDAEQYKGMVKEFFVNVSNTPLLSEEEMNETLRKRSTQYGSQLNDLAAALQLSNYLQKYKEQITSSLRENDQEKFAQEVEFICQNLGERGSVTSVV